MVDLLLQRQLVSRGLLPALRGSVQSGFGAAWLAVSARRRRFLGSGVNQRYATEKAQATTWSY